MNQIRRYSKPEKKSNLKFVKGSETEKPRIRQGGISASAKMQPGQYKAMCEAARITTKFGKPTVEVAFRIIEGDHFGTHLPAWFNMHLIGDVVCPSKYTRQCEAVLGRELEPDDDIDPEVMLVGKLLMVDVRFALTNGKTRDVKDPHTKDSPSEYLRIGAILGPVEL